MNTSFRNLIQVALRKSASGGGISTFRGDAVAATTTRCITSALVNRSFSLSNIAFTNDTRQKATSGSNRLFSSAATDALVDLLGREHSEELENEGQVMPEDLKELKTKLEKEWKIVESDSNALTRMYKTVGGTKVQVSFHCQDTVAIEHTDEPAEPEEEYEPADPVKFTVTITKAGKSAIFTCLSEDAMVKIQSCAVSTEDVDTIVSEGGSVPVDQYQGPEFLELAEDLQDAFHGYLEQTIGLTTDVAAFVSMQTDYKEQLQYIQFLENVKSIVS